MRGGADVSEERQGISASISGMNAVAKSPAVNQAVAALTNDAVVFLCRLHNGDIADDAHTIAAEHHRRLRDFVRCTGVDLSEIPVWNANTTNWRAIARLASPVLRSQSRAG